MAENRKTEIDEGEMIRMAMQMRAKEYEGLTEAEIAERERQKELARQNNIGILEDTLSALAKGGYEADGQEVCLQHDAAALGEANVYLPEKLDGMRCKDSASGTGCMPQCGCENTDTLALAEKRCRECITAGETPDVLILNMASGTEPGGQTRKGAGAQEEDLCRRTSLLMSLESDAASDYYAYNKSVQGRLGTDAIIYSPHVEVIKDSRANYLSYPFEVSVISCSAPMVRFGLEGKSPQEYEEMLLRRIEGMLLVAAENGKSRLILGAFGCGIFGNDAALVSAQFHKAIQSFTFRGRTSAELFKSIDFAVLCRPGKDYNYKEFCRWFPAG
ncbi:MAG: TIGR02452 family protein [Clostridia bacterium]|nr:TIGR02452 family protein [Clostridia bacterium]